MIIWMKVAMSYVDVWCGHCYFVGSVLRNLLNKCAVSSLNYGILMTRTLSHCNQKIFFWIVLWFFPSFEFLNFNCILCWTVNWMMSWTIRFLFCFSWQIFVVTTKSTLCWSSLSFNSSSPILRHWIFPMNSKAYPKPQRVSSKVFKITPYFQQFLTKLLRHCGISECFDCENLYKRTVLPLSLLSALLCGRKRVLGLVSILYSLLCHNDMDFSKLCSINNVTLAGFKLSHRIISGNAFKQGNRKPWIALFSFRTTGPWWFVSPAKQHGEGKRFVPSCVCFLAGKSNKFRLS